MEDNAPSLFSTRDLINLIFPLVCEQLLLMLVNMADTFVVSYVSEAAVSGVSLVNSFNTVFIYLFTALASGGAVIISQYIGRNDDAKAGESSSQLLMISFRSSAETARLATDRWAKHRPYEGAQGWLAYFADSSGLGPGIPPPASGCRHRRHSAGAGENPLCAYERRRHADFSARKKNLAG